MLNLEFLTYILRNFFFNARGSYSFINDNSIDISRNAMKKTCSLTKDLRRSN